MIFLKSGITDFIDAGPKYSRSISGKYKGGIMERGGCYIFLSHSSKNIDVVRRIRNEFEALGQNPIAFHLRCLDENYKGRDEELWNLIYREIDAREWFVYCQSPEAAKSDNVQKERAYIAEIGKKKIWDIDVTDDWENIRNRIHRMAADIQVFISYARQDEVITNTLKELLIDADYSVWTDLDLLSGNQWITQINDAILRSVYKGFFIVIIFEHSIQSESVKRELMFAKDHGAWIIPVIVGNPDLPFWLAQWQYYKCVDQPTAEDFTELLKEIDRVMVRKIHNSNM